jgi:hypothetical protein
MAVAGDCKEGFRQYSSVGGIGTPTQADIVDEGSDSSSPMPHRDRSQVPTATERQRLCVHGHIRGECPPTGTTRYTGYGRFSGVVSIALSFGVSISVVCIVRGWE